MSKTGENFSALKLSFLIPLLGVLILLTGCSGPPKPLAEKFCEAYKAGDWNGMLNLMPSKLADYFRSNDEVMKDLTEASKKNAPSDCQVLKVQRRKCRDLYFVTKKKGLKESMNFDISTVENCGSFDYELTYDTGKVKKTGEMYLIDGQWRVIPEMASQPLMPDEGEGDSTQQ